ncbi:MAG TPA: DUF4913 domain-containing protein [Actinophytocola sp.]|nr:DUF4913 domain-containing protein [Actinophytocola sp.]
MTPPLPGEEQDEPVEDIRQDEMDAARAANLHYASVLDFVTDRFVHLVPLSPPGSGQVWCPEWYRHAQAISRLDSVWRAWETLRFDPALGMSNWWVHHADPHMRALMDPVTGPFAQCTDGHRADVPLPLVPPPPGVFADQRDAWVQSGDPFALD